MNIAFLNQNALIQREAVAALKRVPHVRVIALDIQIHPRAEQAQKVTSILEQHRCDMVFSINEWGIDDGGVLWGYCDTHKIVHVNWTVDDPFYEEIIHKKKYRPSKYRIDFVSDRGYLEPMTREGYNVTFLPLAFEPELFHLPAGTLQPRDLDVVFVGNSYLAQIDAYLKLAPGFIDTLIPFLGEIVGEYLRNMQFDVEGAITKKLKKTRIPDELTFSKAHYIAKHAAGYFGRKRLVRSLVERFDGFTVFGEPGWLKDIPAERLKTAKYYDTLCGVYQRAKITIDINRMVIRDGFTQRAFDAPACGSMLITSAKPVVYDTFTTSGTEKEVVVFKSQSELHSLINYYLSHSAEREEIALRGRQKVAAFHTYDHRIATMFSVIKQVSLPW